MPAYLDLAFPYYWHHDVLRALDYFRRSGADPDPRMAEAVEVVRSKRQPDGRWLLDRIHPGQVHFDLEGGVPRAVGTPSARSGSSTGGTGAPDASGRPRGHDRLARSPFRLHTVFTSAGDRGPGKEART